MMRIPRQGEKGFTLIEILIAVALLAILGTVVIPNVIGYLGRGETQAYKADTKLIQSAVDAYYADPATRVASGANKGKKLYPLKGTEAQKISGGLPAYASGAWTGTPTSDGYFIDFALLVTGNYLTAAPESASTNNGAPTGQTLSGSYSWYVFTDGKVGSLWTGDNAATGFQPGIYP